jgi:hypothetical protein
VDPKAKPDPKKKDAGPPPITKFSVTIDAKVPPGPYDVRLVNKHGVSNPRVFIVGTLNEAVEKEPNNDVEQAQKVEVGTTVSGVINPPTDVDYTSFAGKKGQRVLITCLAASIDSKMDPEMTLFDPAGREVARHRTLNGRDGVMDVVLPADGDYLLRLNQFTYTAGGTDHFYRLNIGAGPWIDAVFPPMIEPGKTAQVTLYGRNLPGGQPDPTAVVEDRPLDKLVVSITAPGDPASLDKLPVNGWIPAPSATLDGFEYRFTGPTGVSNAKIITFAKAPVILEKDDNDTAEKAQPINVPCEVAGKVDKKRDRDWFVFNAKKGDTFVIELFSDRLGAPTDMYLRVVNLTGKMPADMTTADDITQPLSFRMFTATADPEPYRFTAPADGKYQIMVASHLADNQADPRHVYRLRITPEKPDFRLVVMPPEEHRPDACVLLQGGHEMYTVFVHREDGFKDDITLTVEGLPPGVTCPPQVLSRKMKFAHLVIAAADGAPPFTGTVRVIGTATHEGKKIVHEARPATIAWPVPNQQNIRTMTRLDRSLMLAVRPKAPGKLQALTDKLVLTQGEKKEVKLKLTRSLAEFKSQFQVTPVQPEMPQGMNFGNLNFTTGKDEQTANVQTQGNTPPGTYSIVFRGFAPISPEPKAKPVNTILNSNPVTVVVLPKQVANLSVDNANPQVKVGGEAAITVKVQRLNEYEDDFKIEAVLPPNAKGLTVEKGTIAPSKIDTKLKLKVAQGTQPMNVQNVVIRATATVNGNVPLKQETKINVNIVK